MNHEELRQEREKYWQQKLQQSEQELNVAQCDFFKIYKTLQKSHGLRMHAHIDQDYALIEIWEYNGDVKGPKICRVKEEKEEREKETEEETRKREAECYRQAASQLKSFSTEREGKKHERRAG